MIIETLIAAAVSAALGGLGIAPFVSRATVRRLREKLLADVREEAGLLAQQEATDAEANERLRLEAMSGQYAYAQIEAARLAEENRQTELANERLRLETEANRQATVERELALAEQREKNQFHDTEAEAALLREQNEQARIQEDERQRQHELVLEQQRTEAVARELELEGQRAETARLEGENLRIKQAEQTALEQYRMLCEQKAEEVKSSIDCGAIEALLRGKSLAVHVDDCYSGDVKLAPDKTWVLSVLVELLVGLDMPLTAATSWELSSHYPTFRDYLQQCGNNPPYSSLGAALQRADLNLVVIGHKRAEFAEWEMVLTVRDQLVLLVAIEFTRKPQSKSELVVILGKLLMELFLGRPHPALAKSDKTEERVPA